MKAQLAQKKPSWIIIMISSFERIYSIWRKKCKYESAATSERERRHKQKQYMYNLLPKQWETNVMRNVCTLYAIHKLCILHTICLQFTSAIFARWEFVWQIHWKSNLSFFFKSTRQPLQPSSNCFICIVANECCSSLINSICSLNWT